jgi:hypothetical protein
VQDLERIRAVVAEQLDRVHCGELKAVLDHTFRLSEAAGEPAYGHPVDGRPQWSPISSKPKAIQVRTSTTTVVISVEPRSSHSHPW